MFYLFINYLGGQAFIFLLKFFIWGGGWVHFHNAEVGGGTVFMDCTNRGNLAQPTPWSLVLKN